MRTHRQIYTAAFPESVTATPIFQALPVSATRIRSDTAKAKGNVGSKKKCIRRELWDKNIPTELLQDILSRLQLKINIHASLVCKTWLQAAVSIRKLQSRPWLFYPQKGSKEGDYILFDPSKSQSHNLKFPELKKYKFSCSKDGWLLVITDSPSNLIFFLNPFTGERVNLPEVSAYFPGCCLTFSSPPTSTGCFVIFFSYHSSDSFIVIDTWRPGESGWTTYEFLSQPYGASTSRCLFLNNVFYCLSTSGNLGVFDPFRGFWDILPVKPSPNYYSKLSLMRRVWMTEHEGDVFLVTTQARSNYKLLVFKLNLEFHEWEEMRESGLTVFASHVTSFTRSGLSAEERNKIYTPHCDNYGRLSGYGKRSHRSVSNRIAWLQPPHNNFSF